ncbi:MAG: SDR family oxidoreductase [Paludibacteraceae bacterium]|nr:SDR family oxidoreductase [Paludibacteraceae bacterium]
MNTLLITGGSSGIGKATASLFAERGWCVFELSRHGVTTDTITHVDCDVRDAESVRNAVTEVLRQIDHLDVVISNAGFGISGSIEFTDIHEAERQMDVNFMGSVRLVQAVLPQLRKQHGGRIIFTSSVAALLAVPYQSFYSASKAAINAFALALANEVRKFGIRVSVMMPGDVSTGFTDARSKSSAGQDIYSGADKAVTTMERDERNGMSPQQMARLFYHIATCRRPRPQYVGGFSYRVLCLLDCILPKRLVNWLEYKVYS